LQVQLHAENKVPVKIPVKSPQGLSQEGDGEVLEPSYARDEAIQGISMSLAKSIAALAGTAYAIANHRHDFAVA